MVYLSFSNSIGICMVMVHRQRFASRTAQTSLFSGEESDCGSVTTAYVPSFDALCCIQCSVTSDCLVGSTSMFG